MSSLDPTRPPSRPPLPDTRSPAPPSPPPSAKVGNGHLQRNAIVYIRQSSPQQVSNNRESTSRQYSLEERATQLGWPPAHVQVVDEDQGKSGQSAADRPGFQ